MIFEWQNKWGCFVGCLKAIWLNFSIIETVCSFSFNEIVK